MSRADRTVLLGRLVQDLAAARAAGAAIHGLVATPPALFADSCAAGLMSRSAGVDMMPLLGVCLGTGVVAAGAAWFALKAGVQALDEASFLDARWFVRRPLPRARGPGDHGVRGASDVPTSGGRTA